MIRDRPSFSYVNRDLPLFLSVIRDWRSKIYVIAWSVPPRTPLIDLPYASYKKTHTLNNDFPLFILYVIDHVSNACFTCSSIKNFCQGTIEMFLYLYGHMYVIEYIFSDQRRVGSGGEYLSMIIFVLEFYGVSIRRRNYNYRYFVCLPVKVLKKLRYCC